MDESLKRRLVGVIVLVCLVVIFVPMLLEDEPVQGPEIQGSNIPPRPQVTEEFHSGQIRPAQEVPFSLPPGPAPQEPESPQVEPVSPAALQIEPRPLPLPVPEAEPVSTQEFEPVPEPAAEPVPEPVPEIKSEPKPVPAPTPEPKPAPAPKPAPTPKPAPKPNPEPQPAPEPKPLPRTPAAQEPSLSSWVVQVASLSSTERADQLVAELRKAKYPAFREPVQLNGRTLYRVRIGPEADRRLAEAMAAGVNKRFGLDSKVVGYP